jgi:hypothetical protein
MHYGPGRLAIGVKKLNPLRSKVPFRDKQEAYRAILVDHAADRGCDARTIIDLSKLVAGERTFKRCFNKLILAGSQPATTTPRNFLAAVVLAATRLSARFVSTTS